MDEADSATVRVVTWNVQGSAGLDVSRVAAVVAASGADLVALQEVQRRQAAALAGALSMSSTTWVFKHWPVVTRAEGLAVLTGHRIVASSSFVLRRRPFWDWRRRVGLHAIVDLGGHAVGVVDVHLSPHDEIVRRADEARVSAAHAGDRSFVVGDFNDVPDRGAHAALIAAGWVDCWRDANAAGTDDGWTNWTGGSRVGRPPSQRLDYIFAPPGSHVEACAVLAGADRYDDFAGLSDHLPVAATVRLAGGDH
ncbi:MAG: endonuclease/exonuclease/phosphatase family protein [Ilumatobacteraceae bacterium]